MRYVKLALLLALLGAGPLYAASLDEAVQQVRDETQGKILSAQTVDAGRNRVHRIKVLTEGRVRIYNIPADQGSPRDGVPARSGDQTRPMDGVQTFPPAEGRARAHDVPVNQQQDSRDLERERALAPAPGPPPGGVETRPPADRRSKARQAQPARDSRPEKAGEEESAKASRDPVR